MDKHTSDNTGWIPLHRKIQDNPIWKESREFSKAEAWLDILMEARHSPEPHELLIGYKTITCNRGQCIKSLDTWAHRWKWSKSKVRRVLHLFQDMKMIELENVTKTTRITVCNYDTYNTERNEKKPQVKRIRNASETHSTPNNNVKNVENENNLIVFEEFRKAYPGRKGGQDVEYGRFKKKANDYKTEVKELMPALNREKAWRTEAGKTGQFVAEWKNLATWINKKCWRDELPEIQPSLFKPNGMTDGQILHEETKCPL